MKKFEQLTFLFNCGVQNRGLCRLDFDEAALLYQSVRKLDTVFMTNINGIEIGRAAGGSTILLASAMRGKLLSIDKKPQNDTELEKKMERLNIDNVTLLEEDSRDIKKEEVIELLGDNPHFVFIDGDHSYEGAGYDHQFYGELVRKGGYVIHHDMTKARPNALADPRLERLKQEIIQSGGYRVEVEAGSLVVFEKL